MACSFSANQFQQQFVAPKLCNWQVPKWHPSRPIQRTGPTKIISNDRGHLLPGVPRPSTNPWGHFKGTWQLPEKISRNQAFQLSATHAGGSRWAKPLKKKKILPTNVEENTNNNKELLTNANDVIDENNSGKQQNLTEYIPGDIVKQSEHNPNREFLEKKHRHHKKPHHHHHQHHRHHKHRNDNDDDDNEQQAGEEDERNKLYLENHECVDLVANLNAKETRRRECIPHVLDNLKLKNDKDENLITIRGESVYKNTTNDDIDEINSMAREVTDKPGERNATPIFPAFCNFQVARKMHVENLEHQPLPDSIMDSAYRRLQAQGAANPELALNVVPTATGVGVKTYMAGPTHCTKLKVYRPKTCGIVPKPLDRLKYSSGRPHTCTTDGGENGAEKMGAMDLAICWDYRPCDPRDEPKRPAHIDGSNGSAAPAVFTLVKTPRTPLHQSQQDLTGRSGGVFSNTLGENDFFDKDIMRQKAQFGSVIGCKTAGRGSGSGNNSSHTQLHSCSCGKAASAEGAWKNAHRIQDTIEVCARPRSISRRRPSINNNNNNNNTTFMSQTTSSACRRRCKSSPNLSQIVNIDENENRSVAQQNNNHLHVSRRPITVKVSAPSSSTTTTTATVPAKCHHHENHHQTKVNKLRLCEQNLQKQLHNENNNNNNNQQIEHYKPFKVGIPNSNSSGTCTSFDSGCGSSSSGSMCSSMKTNCIRVPKPRHPYTKRDYVIDTLAPPFACWRGGAGQGGYPEHWRLASVYQHAYKPIEQRKRPLLATVYQ